jgi:uncharacterized oxidoreductase
MAQRFLKAGSEVIICGRREDKLKEAQAQFPQVKTLVADVATEADRVHLFEEVTRLYPTVNVLVNNAGIQRRMQLMGNQDAWSAHQQEIAINLEAPIHLSMLFMNHLAAQRNPAIVNVTSGLAFTPLAIAPIYSATKAALHSFTLAMRFQLADTPIKVIEVVPPAVNTDLGGAGLHTWGADLNEFTDSIMARLEAGELEIGFGTSEARRKSSREELDEAFTKMNQMVRL